MASPIHITLADGSTHHVLLPHGADPAQEALLIRHAEGRDYSAGWVPVESPTEGVERWIRREAIVSLTLTQDLPGGLAAA